MLKRCVRDIGTVRKRICTLDLRGHGWEVIGRGLHRACARARRPLREKSALTDAARHTWRKHIKTLWYHTRLLAGVCGKKMSGLSDDLDTLGELFGEDRDLAVLAAHLRRGLLRDAPPRVREPLFALIGESRAALFRTGRDKAAALLDETPRVFARRVGKWWHAGRD